MIVITPPKYRLLILFVLSFIAAWAIFGPTLKIARQKQIVDNPEARKLQKKPVPILGGVVVFFGIAVGLMFFKTMFYQTALLPVLAAMVAMLYVGTIDDIVGIRPVVRLLIETGVALLLITGSKSCVTHFGELWGLGTIGISWGIPLTVVAIVGLINAVNMIDGVDGLLSGFGIMACFFFGLLCFLAHDYSNAALATVTIGSLCTFFIHNVFGKESKMFLGDGGSMMLGIIISWMIVSILGGHFHLDEYRPELDFNLVSFALAVMAIPVADTLRLMVLRISQGHSPLKADNNHLHHLFIQCGFSHLQTTLAMLGMAMFIIIVWLLSWALGAGADLQLYIVIIATAIMDGGGAILLRRHKVAAVGPSESRLTPTLQRFLDKGFSDTDSQQ